MARWGEINDCQAPVSQTKGPIDEMSLAVGTAVRDRFRHTPKKHWRRWLGVEVKNSGDAAHGA
jgi:hypothetical protein